MRRLLLIVVVLLAGCGGGGDGDGDGNAQSDAASSPAASSDVVGETTTTAPGDVAASASTLPGEPPAPPDSGDGGSGGAPNPTPPPAPDKTGPAPVAPGTYQYTQYGTTPFGPPPAQATLVVDAANADGTQVSHRSDGSSSGDIVLRFDASGAWLLSTVQNTQGQTVACNFDPPLPAPPWPPSVGASFSGTGTCTGAASSVQVTGSITEARHAQVGGTSVDVFVISTTLQTSGSIAATVYSTDWYAPSVRLIVHNNTVTTVGGFTIDVTSDLVSLAPS